MLIMTAAIPCLSATPALGQQVGMDIAGPPPPLPGLADSVDPGLAITDLVATQVPGGVRLTFTPPRSPGLSYDVVHADTTITQTNYSTVGIPDGSFPHVGPDGNPQVINLTLSLPPGIVHFAVVVMSGPFYKGISNDAQVDIAPDNTPPATVVNLAVVPASATPSTLTLTWALPAGFDA